MYRKTVQSLGMLLMFGIAAYIFWDLIQVLGQ